MTNLVNDLAGPICPDCEHLNRVGGVTCAACGLRLDRPEWETPEPSVGPTRVVRSDLTRDDLDRLWAMWERLADPFELFPCEVRWPDDAEPLEQHLPEGARLLTDSPVESSQADRLVADLSELVQRFHALGFRFNCLHLGSVVVNSSGSVLGLLMPACVSDRDASAASVCPVGLNCCFAAPEIQGYSTQPPGPASDVFLLAILYYYLSTGHPPRDLVRAGFQLLVPDDPFGPAIRELLENSLSVDPTDRPSSPAGFGTALRRALIRDAGRGNLIATVAGVTDIGLGGRVANEDRFTVRLTVAGGSGGTVLLGGVAVADGMGGTRFGERASRLCIEAVESGCGDDFPALRGIANPGHWVEAARVWAVALNQSALEVGERLGTHHNFGSTLTALFLLGARAILVHAGDSRAFRLRRGELTRLTVIQSYAAELHAKGELSVEEVEQSEFRNVLVSFVGSSRFEPQVELLDLEPGDVYVLCSDGPLDGLTPSDLAEVLSTSAPDTAVGELLRRTKANQLVASQSDSTAPERTPYSDNLTLVVARFAALPPLGDPA